MATFLNTASLNEWIPKLIEASERELIIIVPYIKVSDRVYNYLKEANQRGVETVIVYREDKLTTKEKAKLQELDNLNLMHHPNIHCKCYYNEHYLIITSMNLYEYSEKNNREMGVLFEKSKLMYSGEDSLFENALEEIREIINGAQLEKKSRETAEEGFIIEIIKNEKEKTEEACNELNKFFGHKKFEAEKKLNNQWYCVCKNYFDKINLTITHRAELELKMDEDKIKDVYRAFRSNYNEYLIQGYKIYWNGIDQEIMIYVDKRYTKPENQRTQEENYMLLKKGADETITYLRNFL